MTFDNRAEWGDLTPDEQWQCMQLSEQHEAELNKLLNLFECPEHGQGCIPHAIAEVKRLQGTKPLEIRFSPDDRAAMLEKLRDRIGRSPDQRGVIVYDVEDATEVDQAPNLHPEPK